MPIDPAVLEVVDIVLCKVAGNEYLHLVNAIENGRYQIGNNRGFINRSLPQTNTRASVLPLGLGLAPGDILIANSPGKTAPLPY
jgi:hypothetical protein